MAAALSVLVPALVVVALRSANAAAPATGVTVMELVKFTDPEAVCMDGSPGGFYWAPATTQPDQYVLYLEVRHTACHSCIVGSSRPPSCLQVAIVFWARVGQGGGWCYDEASCASRCGKKSASGTCSSALASTTVWQTTQNMTGLFSSLADKSPLCGANKAYLRYCTGDAHMGNRAASKDSFGWNFKGQKTIEAALAILVKEHGLGSKPGQTLLFGGGSAGGRGAMANLDFLPGILSGLGVT
jgi:hypothetical protein